MGALTKPDVGAYLNRHFVSAFQKVATFQIIGGAKVGGNVAGYFCTSDGLVLHAVAGPQDAETFLREARWANETYQMARLSKKTPKDLRDAFRKAHFDRLTLERDVRLSVHKLPGPEAITPKLLDAILYENERLHLTNPGKIHLMLAVAPLARIDQVYSVVFERILNEKISTNPVDIAGRGEHGGPWIAGD
ncbi:MAG: hypothetical protein U0793_14170 [Gemmataceae bacterium]